MGAGDRHLLDPPQQAIQGAGFGIQLLRHGARATRVDIGDADQSCTLELRQVPRMVAAQGAYADHPDAEGSRHAGTPRSEDSTKSRKHSTSGRGGRSLRARSRACDNLRSELKKSR